MVTMSVLKKEITVNGIKLNVFHSIECPVCTAIDPKTGKEIRAEIEEAAIGGSTRMAKRLTDKYGLHMARETIARHLKTHAPYIQEARTNALEMVGKSRGLINAAHHEAEDVLQDIINIGGDMLNTGEMPVTERLLMGAIKEQGERKKTGSIKDLLSSLSKSRFIDGEIVEDEQLADGIQELIEEPVSESTE